MKRIFTTLYVLILCSLCFIANPFPSQQATPSSQLAFKENKGQLTDQFGIARNDIDFQMSTNNTSVFIGSGTVHYQWNHQEQALEISTTNRDAPAASKFTSYRIDMELIGSNGNAKIIKEEILADVEIYYAKGLNGVQVQAFQKITYENIYPNIDWVLYMKNGVLKYDFIVRSGGNTSDIKIKYHGASSIVADKGSIAVHNPMGILVEQAPFSFTLPGNKMVSSNFVLNEGVLGFATEDYEGTLIIDPELRLQWSTYYGGSGSETGQYLMNTFQGYYAYSNAVTVDKFGSVYLSGTTSSIENIATQGAYQTQFTLGSNAFLVKFAEDGQRLWATYFGGYGLGLQATVSGRGHSVVCDTIGNVYLAGNTFCDSGIATQGAHQQYRSDNGYGWPDLYLVKFDSEGSRQWSTYYGNPMIDEGGSIAVTPDGSKVYLAGASASHAPAIDAIATASAFIPPVSVGNAAYSGFLACFNSLGQRQWGTYIADVSNIISSVYDIDLDKDGHVFLTGYAIGDYPGNTHSIASANSYQPQYSGCVNSPFFPPSCMTDAFLQKWDSNGNRMWGTYYGGDYPDGGYAVACDDVGDVYMTGFTRPFINANNGQFSVASQGSYLDVFPSEGGAFLAKFSSVGQRLWATYYHGEGTAIACQGSEVLLLVNTAASDIATPCAYQTDNSGIFSAGTSISSMLTIFSSSGNREYATYFGGKYNDWGYSLATQKTKEGIIVYTAGNTFSPSGIATPNSFKSTLGSQLSIQRDAYLAKFIMPKVEEIIIPCYSLDSIQLFARDTTQNNYLWSNGMQESSIWAATSGTYVVTYEGKNNCSLVDSFSVIIYPMPSLTIQDGCDGEGSASIEAAGGNDGVYTYGWFKESGTFLSESTGSLASSIHGLSAGNYRCQISTADCDTSIFFTIATYPPIQITASEDTTITAGSSVTLQATGAYTYHWEPEIWLDNARSASPKSSPESTITYTVTGYNEYGCSANTAVTININDQVFIPNSFSPNGDGLNDEFRISSYGNLQLSEFQIFNRWGQTVFYTTDPEQGWTGRYNGLDADMGTYSYFIQLYEKSGKKVLYKGTLTLLK